LFVNKKQYYFLLVLFFINKQSTTLIMKFTIFTILAIQFILADEKEQKKKLPSGEEDTFEGYFFK